MLQTLERVVESIRRHCCHLDMDRQLLQQSERRFPGPHGHSLLVANS